MIEAAVGRLRRHQAAISVTVLALLAYVPALRAAPGRMPTDSKLYVYLDPGRFISDTVTSFDARQFAGWVPHQHIAYLWPTGPWYWVFDTLGVPDWIAHRLWIGTLLTLAGLGVRWVARVLGFSALAALVAALVYQLSPYILPYVSRTSVLLLPFAGLGWIVGLTVLAGRRGGWRYSAAIALVVLTVGAVNATALAMVIPAPVLWLVHATWARTITWRRALATAAKTAMLCTGVSLWWIAMLVIQGRYGADVLAYSESLEAVSFTSTSTEVARGLGYWLFYVRDARSAATTASLDHLVSGRTIVANFAVIGLGLAGIVGSRWEHRRFAALLFGAGVILGVGVHPIDDPSPLMSVLLGDGEGGLALALRSSTRAVPVMLLGAGLGAAALVSTVADLGLWGRIRRRWAGWQPAAIRVATALVVALAAVIGLPALLNGGFVDVALERDQSPPDSWLAATADLDARPDGYRVLQVPGEEFGAFQWGYTVDQPLPGLTERPLLTRDLLPLGSPAAMDLLFALDDRFQTDTVEPDSVAAVSRLFGVDTVWVTGDVAYDRFRLARPEVVTDELTGDAAVDAGLVDPTTFGDPTVMGSVVPMVDNRSLSDPRIGRPIAPVTLVDVADPIPTERVKDTMVVMSGSGDGIVDAAGAGVIDGSEAILYSASIDPDTPLELPYRFVLTDSDRDRAHHWRSSQDVTGFTESASPDSDVLTDESGDQRLPVFEDGGDDGPVDSDEQTVSEQVGPVTARASRYGERFAYLPETRPVMAIDGDPSTAWTVADRADAIGEFIELEVGEPIDHLDLLQPEAGPDQRTITEVAVTIDDQEPFAVALDESSRIAPGQRVPVPATAGPSTIRLTITATTTPQPPIGEAIGGVGFVEIDAGLGPTTEFIRTPVDGLDEMAAADGVDVVLTRVRVEPTDRWRSDPEPSLSREFETSRELDVDTTITLRLDQRLGDGQLAELLGEPVVATGHLLGAPSVRGAAAFDGDDTTAWTTEFDDVVGEAVTYTGGGGSATELTVAQPGGDHSPVTTLTITDAEGSFDVDVDAAPDGDTVVDLPRPIDLGDVRLEISAIEQRFIQNRRFNEPTLLPAAISEVRFDGESPAVAPVERLGADCRTDLLTLDGEAVAVSYDVATDDALAGDAFTAELCDPVPSLGPGSHQVRSAGADVNVDRVVFSTPPAAALRAGDVDPTTPIVLASSRRHRSVEVPACPDGCWLVHGEGYNEAWEATVDGRSLGEPTLIDGNANGWWIEPSSSPTRVDIGWTAQRGLNVAFVLTALSIVVCVGLILWSLRRRLGEAAAPLPARIPGGRRSQIAAALVTVGAAALFIDVVWAIPAAGAWVLAIALGRPRLVGWIGAGVVVFAGLTEANVVRTDGVFPDAGWPLRFEWLHGWTLLGVVLVTGSALVERRRTAPIAQADGADFDGEVRHESHPPTA